MEPQRAAKVENVMTAQEIKKAIIEAKTAKPKPIEPATILGVTGWLYRASSFAMEGWRELCNHESPDKRRLGPAKLIQISFCDGAGSPVFEELDLTIIAGIEDGEIYPVYKRILAINGFGNEGIESILKNLVAISGVDGVHAALATIGAPCPSCSKGTAPTSFESNTSSSSTGR